MHSIARQKRLQIVYLYSHSSTTPANWVKIGLVDVQTIGLTESLKYF